MDDRKGDFRQLTANKCIEAVIGLDLPWGNDGNVSSGSLMIIIHGNNC